MTFPCMSLHCELVSVQYQEHDINLFLMIFPHMSLHCKLVPVQYREYDINLFLMIFPRMSLHCMLVPVHYREYIYGLLVFIKSLLGEFEMSLTYNASSGKIPKKATEKETVNLQEPISSKQLNMPEFQSLRTWVCCTTTVVPG